MNTEQITNQPVQSQSRFQITLRGVSLLLIVIGLAVSGYLSYVELTDTTTVCVESGAFNCDVVQSSIYSKMFGIPIAYLGLFTYLMLGAILLLENQIGFLRENGIIIVFGITLFAFLFSMWLVYVQAGLLQALCLWCLTHEVTMTVLFIVSGIRLKRALST
jgi:uncharacterized membrane protein